MCKHSKGGNVFSKYTNKRLPRFYVYGYYKIIINVSKNSNTLFTHLWTIHSIYHHLVSTCNKWMVAYQKLNSSLCFPPPFNYNQYLLNFLCFFNTLNICSYIKDFTFIFFSIGNCYACLNIAKYFFFFTIYGQEVCFHVYDYFKVVIGSKHGKLDQKSISSICKIVLLRNICE
jgi:hypothetical protein